MRFIYIFLIVFNGLLFFSCSKQEREIKADDNNIVTLNVPTTKAAPNNLGRANTNVTSLFGNNREDDTEKFVNKLILWEFSENLEQRSVYAYGSNPSGLNRLKLNSFEGNKIMTYMGNVSPEDFDTPELSVPTENHLWSPFPMVAQMPFAAGTRKMKVINNRSLVDVEYSFQDYSENAVLIKAVSSVDLCITNRNESTGRIYTADNVGNIAVTKVEIYNVPKRIDMGNSGFTKDYYTLDEIRSNPKLKGAYVIEDYTGFLRDPSTPDYSPRFYKNIYGSGSNEYFSTYLRRVYLPSNNPDLVYGQPVIAKVYLRRWNSNTRSFEPQTKSLNITLGSESITYRGYINLLRNTNYKVYAVIKSWEPLNSELVVRIYDDAFDEKDVEIPSFQ